MSDDDINGLYHDLYDSLVRAKKKLKLKVTKNESLLEKIKILEKNHDLNLLAKQLLSQNKSYLSVKIWRQKIMIYLRPYKIS